MSFGNAFAKSVRRRDDVRGDVQPRHRIAMSRCSQLRGEHGGEHRAKTSSPGERLRERVSEAPFSFKTGGLITGLLGIAIQP